MHYFIFLFLSAAATKPHSCNWEDCEHVGKTRFVQTWQPIGRADVRMAETIHFYYPALTYEVVEDIVLTHTTK